MNEKYLDGLKAYGEIMESLPGCEIISTRVFNASRELVFKAWSDPGHLVNWWGPAGFTNTFEEFDLRPGGSWKFIMHDPQGVDHKNEVIFIKINKPYQLVWDHISKPLFQVNVVFEKQLEKTNVIFRMLFGSATACEKVKKYAVAGNEQNFDRLEAELERMQS